MPVPFLFTVRLLFSIARPISLYCLSSFFHCSSHSSHFTYRTNQITSCSSLLTHFTACPISLPLLLVLSYSLHSSSHINLFFLVPQFLITLLLVPFRSVHCSYHFIQTAAWCFSLPTHFRRNLRLPPFMYSDSVIPFIPCHP